MNESRIFMAFAKGSESTEGTTVNRYIGVAPVTIESINPNKAMLEKIYNTSLENEPEYTGTQESNGNQVPYARITFLVKPDPVKTGMDINPISISMFLRKEYKFNRDGTKVLVIDEYGNSGWATKEQCQNHTPLLSKEGKPLKISTNYRPAYVGELELTNFIKAFLVIPEAFEYVEGQWRLKKDADLSISRFDNPDKFFEGDFSEIIETIAYWPENKVKVLFGVKRNDDGRMHQNFYKEMFLKNRENDYSKLDKDVQERKNAGAYPTTDFEVCDFKVYEVAPTNLNNTPAADPFAPAPASNPWFNA